MQVEEAIKKEADVLPEAYLARQAATAAGHSS
jgi:hypothetical protein